MVLAIDGGVLKSDVCLPTSTRVGLARGIASLRGHLRSNAKQEDDSVIDLVDPYLFPFRWARTRCLRQGAVSRMECIRRCSEGEAAKMPPEDDCRQDAFAKYRNEMAWSRHYQWLPFDVRFEDDGRGRSR